MEEFFSKVDYANNMLWYGELTFRINGCFAETPTLPLHISRNNVLDSTKEFSHMIDNEHDLEGLPSSLRSLMALYAGQEIK